MEVDLYMKLEGLERKMDLILEAIEEMGEEELEDGVEEDNMGEEKDERGKYRQIKESEG